MKLLLAVLASLLVGIAWAAGNQPPVQGPSLSGVVLEVKDVDAYTYLRLKTREGETWAAVNKSPVKVGAEVTIVDAAVMANFESKALKKTFDTIVFGTIASPAPAAGVAHPGGDLTQLHAGVSKASDVGDVKVQKAKGADAKTVAEIVGKKAELKDKPVTVQGKVVKFTSGVMGKNWIHLRDGSGSAADSSNDILVTTLDETQIGAVVVAKGIVRTDVDLGSGYSYKVLVADAKLQK
ncbi:MAG: nucleotide-binding protein [Betaproteobacteria bacterium]